MAAAEATAGKEETHERNHRLPDVMLDKNGDGKLTEDELRPAGGPDGRSGGGQPPPPPEEQ